MVAAQEVTVAVVLLVPPVLLVPLVLLEQLEHTIDRQRDTLTLPDKRPCYSRQHKDYWRRRRRQQLLLQTLPMLLMIETLLQVQLVNEDSNRYSTMNTDFVLHRPRKITDEQIC
jgi:hypothetical protein